MPHMPRSHLNGITILSEHSNAEKVPKFWLSNKKGSGERKKGTNSHAHHMWEQEVSKQARPQVQGRRRTVVVVVVMVVVLLWLLLLLLLWLLLLLICGSFPFMPHSQKRQHRNIDLKAG
ncbi:unnamed protein product [Polarella glacialis]|uniref:Uncharacterized protein n=1 Tax=Polarella glacialis TaxID=89957 RepID=A0A813I5V8_POLGL|nr:unnamed protein product [Polarella glacialis]